LISSQTEYLKAREELEFLTTWLTQLERRRPENRKVFTISGIRKKIAKLHEELAAFEGRGEPIPSASDEHTDAGHSEGEPEV
jgi:hypothetical protein